ncbi:hypothetical protein OJAV_G00079610 [Oryzias javanicus]|uniref:Uncharacterized protein n=1 Tax=Oryzias javanicus TaxID=123683 RepID=A0A437D408_ORYJA|nr:hypothetical protein OJAV_G00079610 [Oryzias javanicus]
MSAQALEDTFKHIHTLTRPCTRAHASAHCRTDWRWHLRKRRRRGRALLSALHPAASETERPGSAGCLLIELNSQGWKVQKTNLWIIIRGSVTAQHPASEYLRLS